MPTWPSSSRTRTTTSRRGRRAPACAAWPTRSSVASCRSGPRPTSSAARRRRRRATTCTITSRRRATGRPSRTSPASWASSRSRSPRRRWPPTSSTSSPAGTAIPSSARPSRSWTGCSRSPRWASTAACCPGWTTWAGSSSGTPRSCPCSSKPRCAAESRYQSCWELPVRRLPGLIALALAALVPIGAACAPAAAPGTGAIPSSSPAPTAAPPAAATASSGPSAPAVAPTTPPRATVRMALQGRPDQAPLELGLARGYFAEQGIAVEPVSTGTGAEVIQAIATSQIDVGTSSPNAALFNAFNRGVDIRLVADWARLGDPTDRTLSIVVRGDLADSVRSMADLRGRTFAVGGAAGNVGDELFVAAVENDGVSRAEVDLGYLSLADVLTTLGGRSLDASTLTEPQITQAELQNVARVLYPGGAVIPGAYLSLVIYSPEFAQKPDIATRWMVAYLQGVRDYWAAFHQGQDRDAAIAILSERLSLKDRRVWETASPEFVDLNGRIDVTGLRQQAEFFQRQGSLTEAVPDLRRFVDPRFAEAAVRQIGTR